MKRKRLLLIGVITCMALTAMIAYFWAAQGPTTRSIALRSSENAVSITLSLLDKETTSRTHGHPDSPLGVWGQNRYSYDGDVEFGGLRARYASRGYSPLGIVRLKAEYYLLTRAYFVREDFRILRYVPNGALFMPTDILAADSGLLRLDFSDRGLNYHYKLWCLQELCSAGRCDEAGALFDEYSNEDARWPYRAKRNDYSDTQFADFLKKWITGKNRVDVFDSLCQIITSWREEDDFHVARRAADALRRLDEEKAKQFLKGLPDPLSNLARLGP